MKVLFVVILHQNKNAYKLFSALRKNNIKGTVLPAKSLKSTILDDSEESIPSFVGLRHVLEYEHDANYIVFSVVDESMVEKLKNIVNGITKEINEKIGIMFALPLSFVEGME